MAFLARIRLGSLLLGMGVTLAAAAGGVVDSGSPSSANAFEKSATSAVLSDVALDALRGGFDDGQGLRASFGIERSTTINGLLVTVQSVQIADLSRITADQARQLATVLGGGGLIRNGTGNTLQLPVRALAGATVIQNTLDDQTIKNATVINTSSNSLRLLQGINANGSLRDALLAPLAARP